MKRRRHAGLPDLEGALALEPDATFALDPDATPTLDPDAPLTLYLRAWVASTIRMQLRHRESR